MFVIRNGTHESTTPQKETLAGGHNNNNKVECFGFRPRQVETAGSVYSYTRPRTGAVGCDGIPFCCRLLAPDGAAGVGERCRYYRYIGSHVTSGEPWRHCVVTDPVAVTSALVIALAVSWGDAGGLALACVDMLRRAAPPVASLHHLARSTARI